MISSASRLLKARNYDQLRSIISSTDVSVTTKVKFATTRFLQPHLPLRNRLDQHRHITTRRALLKQIEVTKTDSTTRESLLAEENQLRVAKNDDDLLRRVFDHADVWKEFSASSRSTTTSSLFSKLVNNYESGLFNNPYLKTTSGLRQFSRDSLQQAKLLTAEILAAKTTYELKDNIKRLDRLSDTLCQVIDLAEFVRMAHPDSGFVSTAQECHEEMFDFMNQLNTNTELCNQLSDIMKTPEILKLLTDEEKVVGKLLLEDFKKSGVYLAEETRDLFVQLSNHISVVGQKFLNEIGPAKYTVKVPAKSLKGLPSVAMDGVKIRGDIAEIPTVGPVSNIILSTVRDEQVRKEVWAAGRSAKEDQVDSLNEVLDTRNYLATMMGKESYCHYMLEDKMARSPENVLKFLNGLLDTTYPLAKEELDRLAVLKKNYRTEGSNDTEEFQAWDRDYYTTKYLASKRKGRSKRLDSVHPYFSVGTVMQGLSRLFSKIYGIRFVPHKTKHGEVWHNDVRRLDVVCEEEGRIGVVYCDLFQRAGKSPNPAHYTVRCSRQVFVEEFESKFTQKLYNDADGTVHQLPTIALICDFTNDGNPLDSTCLLSFNDVQTLFHEMGHAMHSMLGRTTYHNVSGTRCVADFVELPSILMEYFASSPEVLALYARHYLTNEPLPIEAFKNHLAEQSQLQSMETYAQIKMALLDQSLHNTTSFNSEGRIDSTKVYHEVEAYKGLFPDMSKSQWHAQFGHLIGYGTTYYCYLLDRMMAEKVWNKLFKQNPLNREAGSKFRNGLLKWGGSRDAWACIADVLEKPELTKGDEAAMDFIGRGS
ncbi:zincin [Nadsonia fulvescens var. elongata DSM 6958]|uniref:Mitochondrial intermediate peptidase n=1 Tax=Nadsonia fulvescens var. elongata DSM 6958 TaxID=857566 RepID=A0A1E3PQI0_9ASCO|nr:zincin [Nadsonia fulvescens var. elongata DSM 6958]